MADLLGSILNSMDKPPSTLSEKQKKVAKKQKEAIENQKIKEKDKLRNFQIKVEAQINNFIKDANKQNYKFEPMEKFFRTVIHDVADVAGLTAFSFGENEVDRYVMLFKKEFPPSDDELLAYRRGEEWDPEKHKAMLEEKENEKKLIEESAINAKQMVPNSDYKDKYEKLIGKQAPKEGAIITTPNKQFGFVPSENKRDQRSIEQTLADIKAKKKQKLDHNPESSSSNVNQEAP